MYSAYDGECECDSDNNPKVGRRAEAGRNCDTVVDASHLQFCPAVLTCFTSRLAVFCPSTYPAPPHNPRPAGAHPGRRPQPHRPGH